jgi:hypothetical protein
MFELFSDMYFVVYKLYYIDQNDDLDICARLRNWDGGSSIIVFSYLIFCRIAMQMCICCICH